MTSSAAPQSVASSARRDLTRRTPCLTSGPAERRLTSHRAHTKAGDRVVLKTRPHSGRYVVRVMYPGAPELTAATSGRLVLKVCS